MRIDIPTIVFLASVVSATQAVALFIQLQGNRPYAGIGWWFSGTVLRALGFLLMLAAADRRILVAATLANPLILLGLILLGIGTKHFLEREANPWPYIGVFALYILAYYALIFGYDSASGRSLVVSAANCFAAVDIARTLLKHRRRHFAESARFLAAVFASYGLFHAVVAAYSAFPPPLGSFGDIARSPLRVALFILPIVCGVLWTFAFIIMVSQRLSAEKDEEKQKLQAAEKEIRTLLNEKELMLKEVHHRIKNNMSTVASLLSLQAGLSAEKATVAALEEAVDRLRCMTTLYDVLYKSPSYTEISVKDYLPPLIDEIVSNFPNASSVKVVKRVDDFILEVRSLQPLGIIVNELLTNTMKYAFPENGTGTIRVSATRTEGVVTVAVEDDGAGIPPTVDFGESGGFGLTVVDALAKQLRGSIRIVRGRGTRVVLEFPG